MTRAIKLIKLSADEWAQAIAAMEAMTPIELVESHILQIKDAFRYAPDKHEHPREHADFHEKLTAQLLERKQELLQLKQAQTAQLTVNAV
jgi:nitroreductase